MYMIDQGWWFVPNPLNKFTVSLRDNPKFNADGSLTLYFQNESPGTDKEANWLPAPKGEFIPMLRMYWPKESSPSILNGTWKPPAVQKGKLNFRDLAEEVWPMSAIGTKRTSACALHMFRYWHLADIRACTAHVRF